jgi:hypothetical protein
VVIEADVKAKVSLLGHIETQIDGSMDAQSDFFGEVASVLVDNAGRIIVADRVADEVTIFSPEGEPLFRLGGSGSGPGELRAPCCLALLADSELWVRDSGNGRLNAYRLTADSALYLGTVRSVPGSRGLMMPIAGHPEGGLIDVRTSIDLVTGLFLYERHHLSADGSPISVSKIAPAKDADFGVITQSSGPLRGSISFLPFAPKHLVAHAVNGDWAQAVSSDYRVDWRNANDVVRIVVKREIGLGPELTPEERGFARFVLNGVAERMPNAPRTKVPERKPVLEDIRFDSEGNLWVLLSSRGRRPSVADVFDVEGTYIAHAEWPSDVDVAVGSVSLQRIAGVTRDQHGTERVSVVRLRPVLDSTVDR